MSPSDAATPKGTGREYCALKKRKLHSTTVDTRDTPEQAELRRSAWQLTRELAPATVADLDDTTRTKRLTGAVQDAGWLELRDDDGDGNPVATAVESAIVAEALGAHIADTPFAGPVLAADLGRRAGVHVPTGSVGLTPTLTSAAVVSGERTATAAYAVDAGHAPDVVFLLASDAADDGCRIGRASLDANATSAGTDLTRTVEVIPAGAPVHAVADQREPLTRDDLTAWTALGLALTSADLVGVMRGALHITVEYAAGRQQFGVAIGSFQAVQHLLAEAQCLMEGSSSVAAHAAWSVDALEPDGALAAGRVAKAYCASAARTVCETAIQVHGGIGNTWDCLVHVYLRRALLSSQWFGDDAHHVRALQHERLGASHGLS